MRSPGVPELHGLKPRAHADAGGRLRRSAFALVLLLVALSLPTAANAGTGLDVAGSELLSDERTYTRWAHSTLRAPIRLLPDPTSRQITRIRYLTEDGFPEVYLVLRRWSDPDGRTWLEVRIPMLPNGRSGWVRDFALGSLHLVRTRLLVDRQRQRATLYLSGRRIWRAPIGVGTASTPTPAGRFWIRERIRVPDPGGAYGPWAFGTSAYSGLSDWPGGGVVGIHGTNQPQLVPGRPSHGCIRVENPAITRLARLLPIGTPVRIL